MTVDKVGNPLKVGDRVRVVRDGIYPYNFTIEEIDSLRGWCWGSDLPKPITDMGSKNFHNPRYLLFIENNKKPKGHGSKLIFKFL